MVDKGQNFASVATVRAAIFDVLDGPRVDGLWEGREIGFYVVTEEDANVSRTALVDRVIARIAELQNPPHDCTNLKQLCRRHLMLTVVPDLNAPCVQCEKERK